MKVSNKVVVKEYSILRYVNNEGTEVIRMTNLPALAEIYRPVSNNNNIVWVRLLSEINIHKGNICKTSEKNLLPVYDFDMWEEVYIRDRHNICSKDEVVEGCFWDDRHMSRFCGLKAQITYTDGSRISLKPINGYYQNNNFPDVNEITRYTWFPQWLTKDPTETSNNFLDTIRNHCLNECILECSDVCSLYGFRSV